MHYLKLIQNLEKYSKITDSDKKSIKFSFNPLKVRQKEILISENEQCNKLFFVNKGLLRAYYTDSKGNEITRRIAWESGFLTSIDSFRKKGLENNETIECIENAELLVISKKEFEILISSSVNLRRAYQILLEKYLAINMRRFQQLTSLSPAERLHYFDKNFPKLKNHISDTILATFLGISRKNLERVRKNNIGH